MLEPKGEGVTHIQKPRPGEFDVVLRSHTVRPGKPAGGASGRLLVYALVLGAAAWLLAPHVMHAGTKSRPPAPLAANVHTAEAPPIEAFAVDEQPVAQRIDISVPDPLSTASAPAAAPKPLNHCLKQGNVIDQSVATCRFGETRVDTLATTPTSMVSAQYMADYKSGHHRTAAARQKSYLLATVNIREWDGRNVYSAQWHISENLIDNSSVCLNFTPGSVERRECRRSAQVFFREQCKEWGRRVDKTNDQPGKLAQAQYCMAAKTFSPEEG